MDEAYMTSFGFLTPYIIFTQVCEVLSSASVYSSHPPFSVDFLCAWPLSPPLPLLCLFVLSSHCRATVEVGAVLVAPRRAGSLIGDCQEHFDTTNGWDY